LTPSKHRRNRRETCVAYNRANPGRDRRWLVSLHGDERPAIGSTIGTATRSNAKLIAALSFLTLIVFVVLGRLTHPGDAAGLATGGVRDFLAASGTKAVPVSQVGVNALAQEAGHARVAINFTWLLYTASLVLFMQAGFAL